MNSVVHELLSVDSVLLLEVGVESCLDVLDNGLPAGMVKRIQLGVYFEWILWFDLPIVVVNEITETRSINNSESQSDAVLLNICGVEIQTKGAED